MSAGSKGRPRAGEPGRDAGAGGPFLLAPDDLEPAMAAEVAARLNALVTGPGAAAPSDAPVATEAERHVLRRVEEWASASRPSGVTSWWIPVAGLLVLVVLYRLYPSPVELFALVVGMIAWTVFVAVQERRRAAFRVPERLPADLLADVAALGAGTRAERLYVAALRHLADPAAAAGGAVAARETLLAHLNDLLASSRLLEEQRLEALRALAGQATGELDAEERRLRDRLMRAEDPEARVAFEAALALCEERRERAEALRRLRERIEAQQEVAHQALQSARGALAASRTPSDTPEPLIGEIAEAAAGVRAQVRGTGEALVGVTSARSG